MSLQCELTRRRRSWSTSLNVNMARLQCFCSSWRIWLFWGACKMTRYIDVVFVHAILSVLKKVLGENNRPAGNYYSYLYPYNLLKIAQPHRLYHDGVIKWKHFRVTGPLWGESTGPWWISPTKASDAELWCFLSSAPQQTVEQTVEMPVIWNAEFYTRWSLSKNKIDMIYKDCAIKMRQFLRFVWDFPGLYVMLGHPWYVRTDLRHRDFGRCHDAK